ncbi:acyltransferase [Acinetobacter baumannii]|uniref:acyltransferase family protein n=1 Tax=Acinetobacter baumannii TaxID=470 RepID=UPI0009A3E87D|nr:acyltransferase [Acinetobacter baumannii]
MISISLFTLAFFLIFFSFTIKTNHHYELFEVKNKNPINGLRAILASVVMYSHAYKELYIYEGKQWLYTQNEYFEYLGWGNQALNAGKIGVAIFFMISGYLFYSLLNKERLDIISFLKQRIKRIFPLYFFVISFCVSYNFITLSELKFNEIIIPYIKWIIFWGDDSTLKLMNMTGGVEWTLKVEILMYLTIPFLFYLFHKVRSVFLKHILIILSGVFIFLISCIFRIYYEFYIDPRAALCFYIGYAALEIKNKKIIEFIKSKLFTYIALLFFLSSFFVTAYNLFYIYLIFSCSFIFIATANGNDIFGLLMNDQIQKLGEISYSIYLIHGLILFFLIEFAGYFTCYGVIGSFLFIFFYFLLTFIISIVTFIYIEQYFNRPHFRGLLISNFK